MRLLLDFPQSDLDSIRIDDPDVQEKIGFGDQENNSYSTAKTAVETNDF